MKETKNQIQEKIIIQTDYTNTTTLEFPKASRPSTLNQRLKGRPEGLGKQKRLTKSVPQSEWLQIPNSQTTQTYHTSVTSQDSSAKILLNLSTSSCAQVFPSL